MQNEFSWALDLQEVANLFPTIQQIKEIQSIQAYQY